MNLKELQTIYQNLSMLNFLRKKIKQSIEESSFKNLSDLEDKNGFVESIKSSENKRKKFFNLGPKNNWKEMLDKKYVKEIEILSILK